MLARLSLLLVVVVACGGSSSSQQPELTAHQPVAKPAPPAPVVIELVRRPPVGTRWHEVRTYARDQDAAMPPASFAHHYSDLLEADVAIVEQSAEREVEELVVVRHESIVDHRPYPGVQAPGARVRIEHGTKSCRATTQPSGGPLEGDADKRIFSHLFDCALQTPTDNDDDLFVTRTPHRTGETWSMPRATIAKMLGASDAAIVRADVTLSTRDKDYALVATYDVPSAGAKGTFRMVVSQNADWPVLESETDVIRETHERLQRKTVRTMR